MWIPLYSYYRHESPSNIVDGPSSSLRSDEHQVGAGIVDGFRSARPYPANCSIEKLYSVFLLPSLFTQPTKAISLTSQPYTWECSLFAPGGGGGTRHLMGELLQLTCSLCHFPMGCALYVWDKDWYGLPFINIDTEVCIIVSYNHNVTNQVLNQTFRTRLVRVIQDPINLLRWILGIRFRS